MYGSLNRRSRSCGLECVLVVAVVCTVVSCTQESVPSGSKSPPKAVGQIIDKMIASGLVRVNELEAADCRESLLFLSDGRRTGSSVSFSGSGCTILHLAVKAQDRRVVERFARDASLREQCGEVRADAPGYPTQVTLLGTPLQLASGLGYLEGVQILVRAGADLEPQCEAWAPLHGAAIEGHADVVSYLIGEGCDLEVRDGNDDATPLHAAALAGKPEVVSVLLTHGASVDALDRRGRTALHRAVTAGCVRGVRLLLRYGANPNTKDSYGRTPVDIARAELYREPRKMGEIVKLLVQHGATEEQ